MRFTRAIVVALAGLALTAGTVWAQPSTINFNVAGPADWNVAGNWVIPNFPTPLVPGDGFPDEIVGISNGGIAELTATALFEVSGVVIGETHDPGIPNPMEEDGTLNIASNGLTLTISDALRIGDAGRGVLNFTGGSVSVNTVSVGGTADSALNISGDAILAVSTDANLERITRVEGPNVVLDIEGSLRMRGTFVPVITGVTHSAITAVTGNANVGGILRPEFNGHVPSIGESWTLIDADSVGGTFTVDASQVPQAPRGAIFEVSYDAGGSGDVVLGFENRLILTVNRSTGVASIENAVGNAIEFDGYTIESPSGLLDPSDGGWQSLEDAGVGAWNEANPTMNALSELNPSDTSILDVGSSLGLGSPYNFQPTELGQSADELTFVYGVPGMGEFEGIVEYTGPRNNMVLIVDPTTGDAAIQNQSVFSADIEHYTINSASGSLLPGSWASFEDQGLGDWDEANPTVNNLSELNPLGSTIFNTGNLTEIGMPFDVAGSRDLVFKFGLSDGTLITGIVEYGQIPTMMGLIGDTNNDGAVNIDDLNGVRNNFGTGDGTDLSGIPGDAFPFDGFVNIDDLNGVRNNFGATSPAAVPEPSALLLLTIAGALLGLWRRR